jgi:hypothetical protein
MTFCHAPGGPRVPEIPELRMPPSKYARGLSLLGKVLLPVLYAAAGALLGYAIKEAMDNRPGDVHCKVIGFTRERDTWIRIPTHDSALVWRHGTRYAVRLAVVSLHRDFNPRSCSIYVKYREAKVPLEGMLYWVASDIWQLRGGAKALAYPLAQNILALTAMERNRPYDCHATFLIEHPPVMTARALGKPLDFEWLMLRFTDFSGRRREVTIREEDIDTRGVVFDPTVWRDPTPEEIKSASEP